MGLYTKYIKVWGTWSCDERVQMLGSKHGDRILIDIGKGILLDFIRTASLLK